MNNLSIDTDSNSGVPSEQQDLLQYYGLSADPLDNTEEVFLLTPKLEKLLRLLNYLTRFSHKSLVITAESGIGKTQIARKFLDDLSADRDVCQIDGLADDTPAQILHEIAEQCGLSQLESADVEQLRTYLDRYAQDLDEDSRSCLIVIDDADLLNGQVLAALYDLVKPRDNKMGPWHLILFGRPVLEHNLRKNSQIHDDSRHLFHYQLSSFSYKECCQYLQICFARGGDQDKMPFQKADYLRIYQNSGGVPQAIIREAKQVLEEGVDRLLERGSGHRWLPPAAAGFSVMAVVCVGLFFWQDLASGLIEPSKVVAQQEVTGTIDRDMGLSGVAPPMAELDDASGDGFAPFAVNDEVLSEGAVVALGAEEYDTGQQIESSGAITDYVSDSEGEIVNTTSVAVVTESAREVLPDEALLSSHQALGDLNDTLTEEPLDLLSSEATNNVDSADPDEGMTFAGVGGPVVDSHGGASFTPGENNILSWAADAYTLQLLGARTENQVLDFIAPVSGAVDIEYFQTSLEGAPWYVVVLGNYSSRREALNASQNLPSELGKTNPWVRPVKGIHQTLQVREAAPQVSQH